MNSQLRRLFMLLLVALATIPSFLAVASANEFTVTIKGAKQGQFKGGKTGVIQLYGYEFHAGLNQDVNGNYVGFRKYQPVIIRKDLDLASPQILQALATNELLPLVVIQAKVSTKDGTVSQPYKITLKNARIVDIRQLPDDRGNHYEEVSFLFSNITVENGQSSASDDFNASTP